MSILIKGMEMPIDCHSCWMRVYCFERGIGIWGCGKGKPCLLLPLPEKHGRLGDLDALRKEFPEPEDWKDFAQAVQHITGIWATIDNAPTIVPAEGGTDNGN